MMSSLSRYMPPNDYQLANDHLNSAPPPPERFSDDNLVNTCCLPPPSPAPTSDRFVMGMPAPSPTPPPSLYQDHHRYSLPTPHHQGTLSPSSRYRTSSSSSNSNAHADSRYRDLSPKCDRFMSTTSSHYLASSTPIPSSDHHYPSYLSSTLHTPVKRYVPTPPPQTNSMLLHEPYADSMSQMSVASSTNSASSSSMGYHQHQHMCSNVNSQGAPPQGLVLQHQAPPSMNGQPSQQQSHVMSLPRNNIPYKLRLKCCVNEAQQTNITADQYATPPRSSRPLKCSPPNCNATTTTITAMNGGTLTRIAAGHHHHHAAQQQDYVVRTPSVEFMGSSGGRMVGNNGATGTISMGGNNSGSNADAVCTHCSTMRRTTGVHQTTQTTGPISPIPTPMASMSDSQSIDSTMLLQETGSLSQHVSPPSPPSISSISSMTFKLQPTVHGNVVQSQSSHQSLGQVNLCSQQPSQAVSPVPSLVTATSANASIHQQLDYSSQLQHEQKVMQEMLSQASSLNMGSRSILIDQGTQQQSSASASVQQQQVLHHHQQQQQQQHNLGGQHSPTVTFQRGGTLQHRHGHGPRLSRKQRIKNYMKSEMAKFFGVDQSSETHERIKWCERQKRLAIRRFGPLNDSNSYYTENYNHESGNITRERREQRVDRPDILPTQNTDEILDRHMAYEHVYGHAVERKASVYTMALNGMSFVVQMLCKKNHNKQYQWSRSFAPTHCLGGEEINDICDGLSPLQEDEVFFELTNSPTMAGGAMNHQDQQPKIYMGERIQGWRTRSNEQNMMQQHLPGVRGYRIASQCLDGVLDNSRRPMPRNLKLLKANQLDDRHDYRPFFTYWINTVQILVLILSIICYGLGPIGVGTELRQGQVLVTSLSLQQVQHQEQRNMWIGLRKDDLVHLGAKYAACMRRDDKVIDIVAKTRRQERETACCIRNDDSGCVQSSQADCSVRGLWPTKSISTWKKWSPGDSGPGGRISGSVCGLDPKYCDLPASLAPYEWPDDITKWPICRKTNSFTQRFRFKDHTAEHMVCEVIGHPCCTGINGDCRITTREYCDFVNGYFHEEASLCSQVSCLNDVCGMFPFLVADFPDQLYRLLTSLCLHAGILQLLITVAFQHVFLGDLERLLGPVRTAILYIFSGVAGSLTSALIVPYNPEVGPLAALAGTVSSMSVLLLLIHWNQLRSPHLALLKILLVMGTFLGLGYLPWQPNFAGQMAGIVSGVFLTVALVPFVSLTKYGRKSKVSWESFLPSHRNFINLDLLPFR